jgi:tetrapyrrole methylase family protein/MazG family protein
MTTTTTEAATGIGPEAATGATARRITIVGLGPGDLDDLTLGALRALQAAQRVVLRTSRHPCIEPLRALLPPAVDVQSCDDLYEQHAEFADVYAAIVARILAAAGEDTPAQGLSESDGGHASASAAATSAAVVYAVPGHPWVGEATTARLLEAAAARGIAVNVVGGLSFVEGVFAAVGVDLMDGSQVYDAMLLARQHYPQVEIALPLLVAQVYARWLASDLKLTLLAAYPPDNPLTIVRAAGTSGEERIAATLEELDRRDVFNHLTSVYVPPIATYGSVSALLELVAHLRAPEGCPWDREQTLESLRSDLLDETCEVLEAIDLEADGRDNSRHIAEELGDLYLVASMLTQIASEEGRFQVADVMRGVVTKLIRRHPHVFSDVEVAGVDNVLRNWDAIKAQEKADQGVTPHPLDGISAALPALEKARKLQSKAAKAGLLDRQEVAGRRQELGTLLGEDPDEAALGALLWEIVARAHGLGLNAENALRAYTVAFRSSVASA